MTMADRIVVMHDGIVDQIGAPLELYDNPANTFVAGFIGSPAMNFLNGTVTRADGAPAVTTKEGLSLPVPPATGAREGTAVVYGFRPEHLSLSANGARLPAHVDVVEPTGADTLVYCKVGGRPICAEFTRSAEHTS